MIWKGGDGVWSSEGGKWLIDGKAGVLEAVHLASIPSGNVKLEANTEAMGLSVGKGATLDLGAHRLRSRWHATFEPGSTIKLMIAAAERPDRGGRVRIEGNAKLGGTLIVQLAGPIEKGGVYPLIAVGGLREGQFEKVIVPEGCEWRIERNALVVEVPKAGKVGK